MRRVFVNYGTGPGFYVVAEAGDGPSAIDLANRVSHDLITAGSEYERSPERVRCLNYAGMV